VYCSSCFFANLADEAIFTTLAFINVGVYLAVSFMSVIGKLPTDDTSA
jgi:hypothetical protein